MSHTVKIYDTCIGCTQCVRACPTDVLEMVPWDGCKSGQIASPAVLYHHTETDLSIWEALEARANLTYVPATEASRQKGAGAGPVDND